MSGQFFLKWSELGSTQSFDFGIPTGCSTTFSKSVSKFPIVTMSYENTFAIDSKTGKTYSFSYTRKNGDGGMTNKEWLDELNVAIDRWQAESDGFTVVFNSNSKGYPIYSGFPAVNADGYVRSVSVKYKSGIPEALYGSVEFTVGRMRVKNKRDTR